MYNQLLSDREVKDKQEEWQYLQYVVLEELGIHMKWDEIGALCHPVYTR